MEKPWIAFKRPKLLSDRVLAINSGILAVALLIAIVAIQLTLQNEAPIKLPTPYKKPGVNLRYLLFRLPYIQAILFLLFVGLVAFLERRNSLTPYLRCVIVFLSFTGAFLAACTMPPVLDIFYYIAYGREIAILGINPYNILANIKTDPVVAAIPDHHWITSPSRYGPTANLFFGLLNLFSPENFISLLVTFKIGWFILYLIFASCAHVLMRKQDILPFTRWTLFCANPAFWIMALLDAHIELLILIFLALAVWAMQKKKWALAGLMLGLACSCKIVILVAVPFFALYAYRSVSGPIVDNNHSETRNALLLLAGCLAYMTPVYAAFNGGEVVELVSFSAKTRFCPQVVPHASKLWVDSLPITKEIKQKISSILPLIILASGLAYLFLVAYFQRKQINLASLSGTALIWLNLCLSYIMPWYILWGIFLLILGTTTYSQVVAGGIFFTLFAINIASCETVYFTYVFIVASTIAWWLHKMVTNSVLKA